MNERLDRRLPALTIAFACAGAMCVRAADWPNWRGPDRNGISTETGWRADWGTAAPPVVWKAAVGVGFSSVAVADGRLYTLGHKQGKDTVHCLDAAGGKPIWSHSYPSELGDLYFEGGPTSTPTVHGDRVYVLGRWGEVFCFSAADGKVVWSRNIRSEAGARIPGWGYGGSPVIQDKLLLLNVGKAGMALDRDTGKTVWFSENDECGYTTPVVFRRGGSTLALFSSGNTFAAVDIATGKPAWEIRWITRYGVNAADPIVSGDHVFLSSGYNKGAVLLRLTAGEPGSGQPAEVWRGKSLRNQMNPSVLLDGRLYGIDGDTGSDTQLRCVEAATGKVVWSFEGVGAGALCAAGGRLIVLSESGELLIGPASPAGFAPTARVKVINGKCWTVPALSDGRLYCRSAAGNLVCLNLREK